MEEMGFAETAGSEIKELEVIKKNTNRAEYYENVTLEEAEAFILADMKSAVRSVIAIGYYLKNIRDRELYREAGYENIWDYAFGRYGISKSTASRYMARNDRFAVGGNSPILAEEFREYSKAQLQEMLSLNEEQTAQVTPEMTVREIRELRKPAAKEIPYYEIPGQMQITDFPGITEDEVTQAAEERQEVGMIEKRTEPYMVSPQDFFQEPEKVCVATSQQELAAETQQKEADCYKNCSGELSAYGTQIRIYPADSLIATAGCEGGHDCFSCSMVCGIRKEDRWCEEAPCGNPFPCEILPNLEEIREHVRDICEFVNHDLACHRAGDGEPDPCCKHCKEPCEYICGRAMKALDTGEEPPEKSVTMEDRGLDLEEPATSDRDLLRGMLEKERQFLEEMIKVDRVDPLPINLLQQKKLLVGALAGMLCDLEGVEEEEMEQPELPKMKNNDQRKEWLKNYREWGIWYIDEHIGCRYYKYDFDNGARLIVEEYDEHNEFTGSDYTSAYHHLVGGPEPPKHSMYGTHKWGWHRKYNRYPDNTTELVEFLKEIQK